MARIETTTACIGLRAKTGRAIAVVLAGSSTSPKLFSRAVISLADPGSPATSQPYHEVMELPWANAEVEVRETASIIEAVASRALAGLVQEAKRGGLQVRGVGIVGAPDRDLKRIGNAHIRAHAAEGVLFRRVLDLAADANRLRRRTVAERGLDELAASELGLSVGELQGYLASLGRTAGPPWRADEKAAATVAWLALMAWGSR